MKNAELDNAAYENILNLCQEGDEMLESGMIDEAIENYPRRGALCRIQRTVEKPARGY